MPSRAYLLSLYKKKVTNQSSDFLVTFLHPLQSDTLAFLDENNMPGIGKWLRKKKLGIDMGVKAASGFCTYPLYMLF